MTHRERYKLRRTALCDMRAGDSYEVVGVRYGRSNSWAYDIGRREKKIVALRRVNRKGVGNITLKIVGLLQNTTRSYESIGREYGLTKQRVGQIVVDCVLHGIQFPCRKVAVTA